MNYFQGIFPLRDYDFYFEMNHIRFRHKDDAEFDFQHYSDVKIIVYNPSSGRLTFHFKESALPIMGEMLTFKSYANSRLFSYLRLECGMKFSQRGFFRFRRQFLEPTEHGFERTDISVIGNLIPYSCTP